ncbi:hypothetical protein [Caldivirga maquilingensis]|uniref:hypothetical protein n=1 Tax=Caldivirga maquilingensis TaxID=76887 RepID=UPI000AD23666|nr:hypothetical protein [Caldivirga maquilingensis]
MRAEVTTASSLQALIKSVKTVLSNNAARFGVAVMVFYIILAVVGPILLPYNYRTNPAMALKPPRLWPPI